MGAIANAKRLGAHWLSKTGHQNQNRKNNFQKKPKKAQQKRKKDKGNWYKSHIYMVSYKKRWQIFNLVWLKLVKIIKVVLNKRCT